MLMLASVYALAQGKNPVILIPGITGSELVNQRTGEKVWFKPIKSGDDDLRLPISTDLASNRDELVPGDLIRTAKIVGIPVTDIYTGFIRAMDQRGGYREEKWASPSEDGYHDSLYVYPYDWRLDNVENARRLIHQIDALRKHFKRPTLKFDIVAHSMGGIISRYAAMYGDADLPSGNSKIKPTWAGAKYFDKIVLLGTPNEGAAASLGAIIDGFTLGGVRLELPFLQDSSKFTVFTLPAVYELLPAPGTLRAYDDHLEPIDLDLYDVKTWSRFGWDPTVDPSFATQFKISEQRSGPAFFSMMLARAKRLHEALAAANGQAEGVSFYLVGADCGTALDGIVLYRDGRTDKWRTLFQPKAFTRADGSKVSDKELKRVMYSPGDGVVTRRSFEAATESQAAKVQSILAGGSGTFVCEEHDRLAANSKVQDRVISFLDSKTSAKVSIDDQQEKL